MQEALLKGLQCRPNHCWGNELFFINCRGKPLRQIYDSYSPSSGDETMGPPHGRSPLSRLADGAVTCSPLPMAGTSLPEATCHITSNKVEICSICFNVQSLSMRER